MCQPKESYLIINLLLFKEKLNKIIEEKMVDDKIIIIK